MDKFSLPGGKFHLYHLNPIYFKILYFSRHSNCYDGFFFFLVTIPLLVTFFSREDQVLSYVYLPMSVTHLSSRVNLVVDNLCVQQGQHLSPSIIKSMHDPSALKLKIEGG